MDMNEISIIVPVYNTGSLIKKCIIPILQLQDKLIEIICVNDGSTDDSLEVLKQIQQQYPKLIIVDKENGGLSSARNSGLDVAKGNYILFLDSDDWLDIEQFVKLRQCCAKNYDIIHGNFNYTYDDKPSIRNKMQYEAELSGQDFLSKALLTNKFSIPVWINLYKRSFLIENNLRFMEGILHEDEEFNIKAFPLANSIISKNIYFLEYYQRANSITNNGSNGEKRFLDILKIQNEISLFCQKHSFNQDFLSIIQTYMALVVISGYIRIQDKKVADKYYKKIKEMKLHQAIGSYTLEFRVLKIMLRYCPSLFFKLYRLYFNLTSKKI